ncbi:MULTISPECIES: nicotinate phosphoribosyltransferase [unclassified Methanoregula]|uniref:nicotinate phosphoribosyltransferase n=1 Tax=unclassified Methanoregula TaxID=2649730 RepID=UPI0009D0B26E|nr:MULTISPECIES: nicotinate phosphoribosyltransferase [unclassified Methanoregula]OPX62976.1 MAG: putative nicotinate phosphoribosyltransferase [Methanoregula sp. PtaB.Bin085]OPY35189.1 MAG: putative nicotinate phosphoribosyltransferase [Methanoregula sp. PtaU1.Bin006]
MGTFLTVSDEAIRNGECTDIYFVRSEETLKNDRLNPHVVMEVTASSLPDSWAVFCGLADVLALLDGMPLTVDAMPEGTVFYKNEPVLRISGKYRDFCRYETAILGFLCHASGIATAAAHIRIAAGDRPVYSFGSRRQHPAIAAMIERAAWIGGVDGVSNTCAPEGMPVVGTMPHAFVMCYKTPEDAWKAFDRNAPKSVPRIMLCDTYCDEKTESLRAAECGATAVRLDTPRSRRGNMRAIIEEVRWELDAHGYENVKIFLSGGVTREDVIQYRDCVDAFGVGGAIANAPVIDFALDIVEIGGKAKAKRGKRSGIKQVHAAQDGTHLVLPATRKGPKGTKPLIERFITGGKVVQDSFMQDARKRVAQARRTLGLPC